MRRTRAPFYIRASQKGAARQSRHARIFRRGGNAARARGMPRAPPKRKSPRTYSPCRDTRRARCRQIRLILHPNPAKSGKMRKRRQVQFYPVLISARPCVKLFRKTVFNETDSEAKQPEKTSQNGAHSLQRKLRKNQATAPTRRGKTRKRGGRQTPRTSRTASCGPPLSRGKTATRQPPQIWRAHHFRRNPDRVSAPHAAIRTRPPEPFRRRTWQARQPRLHLRGETPRKRSGNNYTAS